MTISLETVSFRYPRALRNALDEVTLEVPADQVTAVMGTSGCGKTTLIRIAAGLLQPAGGRVRQGNGRLALVSQGDDLWSHLRAWEHIAIVLDKVDRPSARRMAHDALDRVGLGDVYDRRPHELSGGQARRLSLARALAVRPAWILLDEPLTQLDDPTRAHMHDLIRSVHRETGAGLLLSTHRADDVLGFASRIGILRDGRLVQAGEPVRVYANPVDLHAALLLGPAAIVHGEQAGSRVLADGKVVADGLACGRVVRPEDVALRTDPAGACVVIGKTHERRVVLEMPGPSGLQHLSGVHSDEPVGRVCCLVGSDG